MQQKEFERTFNNIPVDVIHVLISRKGVVIENMHTKFMEVMPEGDTKRVRRSSLQEYDEYTIKDYDQVVASSRTEISGYVDKEFFNDPNTNRLFGDLIVRRYHIPTPVDGVSVQLDVFQNVFIGNDGQRFRLSPDELREVNLSGYAPYAKLDIEVDDPKKFDDFELDTILGINRSELVELREVTDSPIYYLLQDAGGRDTEGNLGVPLKERYS